MATYCAVSAALSALVCSFAQIFGRAMRLIDRPDGVRKLHEVETPLIGGLALLIPSLGVSIIYLLSHPNFMGVAVGAALLMLIVGVVDDRTGLSPVWRLLVMMFLVFTTFSIEPLFILHTLRIEALNFDFSISLDPVAAPATALVILGFINASNMADGMNGQLLGSIMIWCLLISRHLGVEVGLPFIAVVCSAVVTITFNLRGRLFSGSSGAYAASLFVALGAIAAYRQSNGAMPAEMPLCWFWLPILDCARLMISRSFAGKSPMAGDCNHFHHILHRYMRMRYALIVYLALLGAPGLIAEAFGITAGDGVLLLCLVCYAVIVVFLPALFSWRTERPAKNEATARSLNRAPALAADIAAE